MSSAQRIALYSLANPDECAFEAPFAKLSDVEVVGQYTRWAKLQEAILSGVVEIVAINLDGDSQHALQIVQQVAEVAPECGIVGVSRNVEPQFIIAAMRAGCSQYVRWPVDQPDLRSALDRLRMARQPYTAGSKRICIIGSSGGAGTTTVACNLAMELAQLSNRRCGLVDLNLDFGDIACAFDCRPKYSITDLCRETVELDRMVVGTVLHELPCNVSILPRPEQFDEIRDVTPEGIEQTLRIMGQLFPFVVVDLPRSYNFLSAAAVANADRLLIITQLAVPFLRNATRIYECMQQLGADESKVEIVLNRCNANFERITPDEVEAHFSRPIFAIIPNDYRHVTASRDLGHPIMTNSPNSPARVAIQEMARKLAGDNAKNDDGEVSGLLGKFWRKKPRSAATAE